MGLVQAQSPRSTPRTARSVLEGAARHSGVALPSAFAIDQTQGLLRVEPRPRAREHAPVSVIAKATPEPRAPHSKSWRRTLAPSPNLRLKPFSQSQGDQVTFRALARCEFV